MPKVLVLFHSRTGNTAALADAVAEGARSVKYTEVDVRRVADGEAAGPDAAAAPDRAAPRHRSLGSVDELADYDGVVLGAPARSGAIAAELAQLIDRARALGSRGALVDRVGGAFVSAADGEHEPALWSILGALAGLGMILVPPGPDGAATAATPLGATAAGPPTDAELAAARRHGRRVATVVEWVAHARGHAARGHHHHH